VADRVVVRGAWGAVEWAVDAQGHMPARELYETLGDGDKAKVLALFGRLAETGKITNSEKFKKVADVRGQQIFEFKSFQARLLGSFRPGRRFVVAVGLIKKKDRHNPRDLDTAARILSEHDEWNLT
jgi:hypothetical protein